MAEAREAKALLRRQRPIQWPKADTLTTRDVAFVLNVSQTHAGVLVRQGKLKGRRDGRCYVVTKSDLERYVDDRLAWARSVVARVSGVSPSAKGAILRAGGVAALDAGLSPSR
jgi:excisionase family DNA binding protein